jgi:hypothetical protein
VLQHRFRAPGTRGIALDAAGAVEVDAVRSGHADVLVHGGVDVTDHAGDCGLAVGAGDGNQRNTSGGIVGEEHLHDSVTHRAGLAL